MQLRGETGEKNRGATLVIATVALLFSGALAPAAAQEPENFPGVTLGLTYEERFQPVLAIKPFGSRFGGATTAPEVEAIIARDLAYSNRFDVMDSLPAAMMGDGIDYALWDQLGAVWLLTGQVEGSGDGYVLVLELHDVVYNEVRQRGSFPVPEPSSSGFRMAVHTASDAIVEWAFDEPGMAASRIAFSQVGDDGNQEIFVVDSDGENYRRLTNYGSITMSPAWAPDGRRMAYTSYKSDYPRIYEIDLATGVETPIEAGRTGDHITPTYHPNGRELMFSVVGGGRSGIFTFDVERNCCLAHVAGGRWDDLSPTYSPDGTRVAFNSNRLGTGVPQVYVMPAQGGEPNLITPYVYGQGGYYTSPSWSPTGNRVAFHGRIEQRGRHQILVADVEARGTRIMRLTSEGNNEDATWAPDGRHLVFAGERSYGFGLFVVDTVTGRIRTLMSGIKPRAPEWSPSLATQSMETLRGGND